MGQYQDPSVKKSKNQTVGMGNQKPVLFFISPYLPHLYIIEKLWKEPKGRWPDPIKLYVAGPIRRTGQIWPCP